MKQIINKDQYEKSFPRVKGIQIYLPCIQVPKL